MNGLVLQGGGAKGSYHIGVWKALREVEFPIHAVTGTSIGALNGVMIAQDKYDEVYDLWYNIKPDRLFRIDPNYGDFPIPAEFNAETLAAYFHYLRKAILNGGMDVTPLQELIRTQVDEDKVRSSPIKFGLVTVDLTNRDPLELFIEEIPQGQLHEYLMGSAHLPIFKMDRVDGKLLMDGMFYDNQPVQLLISRPEIDTVVMVENHGLGVKQRVDLSHLTVHRIVPSGDTGRTLDLTRHQARKNLQMGYFDTLRHFKGYLGEQYCILPFDEGDLLLRLHQLRHERIERVVRALGIKPVKSRRQAFEEVIPALSRMLKLPEDAEYRDFFIKAVETAAAHLEIDRFRIYTFDELIGLIRERLRQDGRKVIRENRNLIDRLLLQGSVLIGTMNQEIIVEVMAALLTEEDH